MPSKAIQDGILASFKNAVMDPEIALYEWI